MPAASRRLFLVLFYRLPGLEFGSRATLDNSDNYRTSTEQSPDKHRTPRALRLAALISPFRATLDGSTRLHVERPTVPRRNPLVPVFPQLLCFLWETFGSQRYLCSSQLGMTCQPPPHAKHGLVLTFTLSTPHPAQPAPRTFSSPIASHSATLSGSESEASSAPQRTANRRPNRDRKPWRIESGSAYVSRAQRTANGIGITARVGGPSSHPDDVGD
jgi:hypothetical protein